jgi:hypothetical protein
MPTFGCIPNDVYLSVHQRCAGHDTELIPMARILSATDSSAFLLIQGAKYDGQALHLPGWD